MTIQMVNKLNESENEFLAEMEIEFQNLYPDLKVQLMLISGHNRYARNKKIGLDPFSGFT